MGIFVKLKSWPAPGKQIGITLGVGFGAAMELATLGVAVAVVVVVTAVNPL